MPSRSRPSWTSRDPSGLFVDGDANSRRLCLHPLKRHHPAERRTISDGNNSVEHETAGIRPYITRWAVPVDDTHSLYIGVAHLNSYNGAFMSTDPEHYGVDKFPLVGQTGDRPYEERQMEPGNYDAVVSQGPIANRKAEHLGQTDRGVVLFRRLPCPRHQCPEGWPSGRPASARCDRRSSNLCPRSDYQASEGTFPSRCVGDRGNRSEGRVELR